MKTRMIFLIVFLALAMVAGTFAQSERGGQQGGRGQKGGMWGNGNGALLTNEQKQELQDLISGMREEGATREEIKTAVDALFTEWGIDIPDNPGHWGQKGRKGRKGFSDPQLTDEQREALRTLIQEMKEAEATRDEIKAAIEALYTEWGLDMPERKERWGDVLTEEQQEELRTTVQELKDQGASREEIKAAIDGLFEEWGIEKPDFKVKRGRGKKAWMNELTEEQRTTIRELVQSMKEQGATREEIHEAVKKQLEEWGIGGGDDDGGEGAQIFKESDAIQASNAPNPFNPTTTITYTLKEPGQVSVKVYNTQGQLIRTLVDAHASQGSHSVVWDGLNEKGEHVSSGMYFYKVTSANETVTERMMLMK